MRIGGPEGGPSSMVAYEMESCVQGYHVYKYIWAAMIEEDLYAKENHSVM